MCACLPACLPTAFLPLCLCAYVPVCLPGPNACNGVTCPKYATCELSGSSYTCECPLNTAVVGNECKGRCPRGLESHLGGCLEHVP